MDEQKNQKKPIALKTLSPGSVEAIKIGCTCPEILQFMINSINLDGNPVFFYGSKCPIHKHSLKKDGGV